MGLQRTTIGKLLREDFPGTAPLVVAGDHRDKVASDLKAKLARLEGVDTKGHYHASQEEKERFVCAFSLADPGAHHYYSSHDSFGLFLDAEGRLTIRGGHRVEPALVSNIDEIVQFVQHCQERLARHKALKAKRDKVRELLSQAILAQVRKLAKEEKFDFMSEADPQKLNLYVRLSDEQAVLIHIPFKKFKEFLPQLRSAIVTVRQLHQGGIRFQIISRRKLPWRKTWVTHASL